MNTKGTNSGPDGGLCPRFAARPLRYLSYHVRRLLFEAIRAICLTAVHLSVKIEEYSSLVFPEMRDYSGIQLARALHGTNHRLHRLVTGEEPFRASPLVSMLGCPDGGIDYKRAVGWMTNGMIDVTRMAGSAFEPGVIENLAFLTAKHKIRLHIVTRHTGCAAEKLACDPTEAQLYPHLWSGVAERDHYFHAFLAQPEILEHLNPSVAAGFMDLLNPISRIGYGITPAREKAIRDRIGKPQSDEVVVLPMVVDKPSKIFVVDTASTIFPILERVYPREIQAMVDDDRRVALRHNLNLQEMLKRQEFAQPETCGCNGTARQIQRTRCVLLSGSRPRTMHTGTTH